MATSTLPLTCTRCTGPIAPGESHARYNRPVPNSPYHHTCPTSQAAPAPTTAPMVPTETVPAPTLAPAMDRATLAEIVRDAVRAALSAPTITAEPAPVPDDDARLECPGDCAGVEWIGDNATTLPYAMAKVETATDSALDAVSGDAGAFGACLRASIITWADIGQVAMRGAVDSTVTIATDAYARGIAFGIKAIVEQLPYLDKALTALAPATLEETAPVSPLASDPIAVAVAAFAIGGAPLTLLADPDAMRAYGEQLTAQSSQTWDECPDCWNPKTARVWQEPAPTPGFTTPGRYVHCPACKAKLTAQIPETAADTDAGAWSGCGVRVAGEAQ